MSDARATISSLSVSLPDPHEADNVLYNPSLDQLREFSSDLETMTEFGSPAYVSEQRSRSADRTRNAVDDEFDADDYAHLEDAVEYANDHEMVCLDRQLGRHPDHTYVCRYYVPREYGRIALAWAKLFEPVQAADSTPDFCTVQVPEWDEIAIRVFPEEGVTAVLGSDYTGEAKKSFLRLYMYRAKLAGGLGLHAGSKRVTLERRGELTDVGQLFLGLSATGKSTLTAHGLWLEDSESATMLQDDVCALLPDGTVAGSEGKGLYVKTLGLDREEQPALYDAVTHETAVLENVAVGGEDGSVDFDSDELTANGRAVVLRECLPSADEEIDLDRVDQLFFITRNPLMPPVAKLSPTEAAAAFMLGESIETSAGDPDSAGESIRVVGTNPFIIGPEGEEGNRFRDLVGGLEVDCYILNTGHIGGEKDVRVEDTVTILRELARGTVEWRDDDATGLTVPEMVPGMDISEFTVPEHVDDYDDQACDLRAERGAYLTEFDDLDDDIADAVY